LVKKFFRDHPIHKKIVPFLDYLFLIRPTYFFAIWIVFSAGMYSSQFIHDSNLIWGLQLSLNSILLIIGLTSFCSACFINWQLHSESYYPLQKKIILLNEKINFQNAKIIQFSLFIIGSLLIGISNFIMLPFLVLILYFCTSIINKNQLEPNLVTMTALSLFIYLMGFTHIHFLVSNEFDFQNLQIILSYLFFAIIVVLLIQKGKDSKRGANLSLINFILIILCVLAGVNGFILDDPIASTASITIFPFLIMILIRNSHIDLLRAIRYSLLILAVFLFSTYPQFIWFSFGIYFLSKYYYWHRFDFHYPKIVLENDRNNSK
jgi:hypothetical protein